MKLKAYLETDVLVMGAGLAGIMAAISAAEAGAKVCITSSTKICSGSSFYPGTWGLGLIGPENKKDQKELIETIQTIGEGMAVPELVDTFVSKISEGIAYLEQMGLHLKKPEKSGEREFIPCFDHKNRNWNGLIQQEAQRVFLKRLKELGVVCLPDTELIEGVLQKQQVRGAVALHKERGIHYLSCKSLIIASGGMGGLFQYRLNTDDINGMGQYLGLKAGASLVNVEFMQMMPGFIDPAPKTIYNEKIFRYTDFYRQGTSDSIFQDWKEDKKDQLLELRSSHGPFTSRLLSSAIDERLFREFINNKKGITVRYRKEIWENQPEFVQTYFEWLKVEKHLSIQDPVQIGIFAHASNGGILITQKAGTGTEGLFACGEATGGMHGADRLGGLSTANGLVYGRIAGNSAADYSKEVTSVCSEASFELKVISHAEEYLEKIREENFRHAMIHREESGVRSALSHLGEIKMQMELNTNIFERSGLHESVSFDEVSVRSIRDTYRLEAAATLSQCLLEAILLRRESRGSHYRVDYPDIDVNLGTCITCSYDYGLKVGFIRKRQEETDAGRFFNENQSGV